MSSSQFPIHLLSCPAKESWLSSSPYVSSPQSPVLTSGGGSWSCGLKGCLKIIKNQGCRQPEPGWFGTGAGLLVVVSDQSRRKLHRLSLAVMSLANTNILEAKMDSSSYQQYREMLLSACPGSWGLFHHPSISSILSLFPRKLSRV